MKKIFIFIICLVVLSACSNSYAIADEYKAEYQTIKQSKVEKLVKDGNTIIIDVRSKKEYKKKHIKDAINIPYKDINNIINEVSKDSIVVIYGSTNKVSKKACDKVIDMGYSLVYDLGTINNWD